MNAIAAPSPVASTVELSVARVRHLLERQQFAIALSETEALYRDVPENRDVLYMMAVSQRGLNRISPALDTLTLLERHHPQFSRLYQERGHCYMALKDAPRAIDAFLHAVNINPALPASWRNLQILYRMTAQPENAAMAAGHIAALQELPPELLTATAMFADGDLGAAEEIIRPYLRTVGTHVEAMRLLARIALAREVYDDAEILLAAVLDLAPDYRPARFDYSRALLERHKYLQARAQLELLLQGDPQNRQYLTNYATACVGLGDHDEALRLYRELLIDTPNAAELQLSVAHSLKTLGRRAEAIASYRAAAAARPNFGDAFWSLANLKTYRFSDAEIEHMRRAETDAATPLVDRYHLCFALGKAFEDCGEYSQSYGFYERGNRLKRQESRYSPEAVELNTRLQIETCTGKFFTDRAGFGAQDADPIFIVGLPRAGSTLIEQILASHSQVEGTHELAEIPRMVLELQGRDPDRSRPRYPGVLATLTAADCLRLGEKYLEDTRVYRTGKKYFVDKMPNNFRHLGLIHTILPNAKIIDARREPMACCFSNLKQLFAGGQEFSYSSTDIARYYRTYLELMRHWDAVLPGRILRVEHESVVDDLHGSVRRILAFCGLPFEQNCIDFHKTERSVRTASSEQVRQPLFRDGLQQWKHYESHLHALKESLGDALVSYKHG